MDHRADRKRALTADTSSRWAGTITRTSNDQWRRAYKNLLDERAGLRRTIRVIGSRLVAPTGARAGAVRGYANGGERFQKQRRLQRLQSRLGQVEDRIERGRVSIVRGGRSLARTRHHPEAARVSEAEWRRRWEAERLFICADGEADKAWGNETIRVHPEEGWMEVKLPAPLARLANARHGRYRLQSAVAFSHRSDEWATQAATGAVRYDVTFDPERNRWYLDASWATPKALPPTLEGLRAKPTLGVDLNADHLAAWVLDPSGNPVGRPATIPWVLNGPAPTRDGRLRQAITALLDLARDGGCASLAIEDLDFVEARQAGRETMGRGRRGRRFRRLVSGLPTSAFRARLAGMAANAGLAVVAVDPAYTSKWGAQHWQAPLDQQTSPDRPVSRHHAAAVVIGRRGHGHRARRRPGVTRPHQRMGTGRATGQAGNGPEAARIPSPRQARRHHPRVEKTGSADRDPPGNQATQDRSGPPVRVSSARAERC
jgi:hypothetical protein